MLMELKRNYDNILSGENYGERWFSLTKQTYILRRGTSQTFIVTAWSQVSTGIAPKTDKSTCSLDAQFF